MTDGNGNNRIDLDTPAGRALRRIVRWMLEELEGNMHEVVLIPAPEPMHSTHKIRLCHMQNCDWYRRFAKLYTNCRGIPPKNMRRERTFIRKDKTATALRRLLDGDGSGVYATRLLGFIERFRQEHRNKKRLSRSYAGTEYVDGIPF